MEPVRPPKPETTSTPVDAPNPTPPEIQHGIPRNNSLAAALRHLREPYVDVLLNRQPVRYARRNKV